MTQCHPKVDTGDELPPILKSHVAIAVEHQDCGAMRRKSGQKFLYAQINRRRFKSRVHEVHPLDWFKLLDVRFFGRSELTTLVSRLVSLGFLLRLLRFRSCGGWLLRWGVWHRPLLIPISTPAVSLFHIHSLTQLDYMCELF